MKRRIIISLDVFISLIIVAVGILAIVLTSWTRGFERELQALREAGAPLSPSDFATTPVPEDQNAAPIYAEAFKLMDTSPEVNVRARVLAKLAEVRGRSRCRFEVDSARDFFEIRDHVWYFEDLSSLLTEEVLSALEHRNSSRAVSLLKDNLRLFRSLDDEPDLFSQGMRVTIVRIALKGFVPDRFDLSPKEWKELAETFRDNSLQADFARGLECERARGIAEIMSPQPARLALLPPIVGPYMLLRDGAIFLKAMNQLIHLASQPYADAREGLAELSRRIETDQSWADALSSGMVPGFLNSQMFLAEAQTRLSVARAACLLMAEDAFPEKHVVMDPMTGGAMIYRRIEGGFMLYSPGWDLIDDSMQNNDIGVRVSKQGHD